MTVGKKRISFGILFGVMALGAGVAAAIFLPFGNEQTGVIDGTGAATGPAVRKFVLKDSETGDIYSLERTGRELQLKPAFSAVAFKGLTPELQEEYDGWPLDVSFLEGNVLAVGGPRAVHLFESEADQWVMKLEVSSDNFPELVDESVTPLPVALSEDLLAVYAGGSEADLLLVFRRAGGRWSPVHTIAGPGGGLSAKFGVVQAVISGDKLAVGVVNSERDGVYIFDVGGEEWSLQQAVSPDTLPDVPVAFHVFSKLAFSGDKLAMAVDDTVYLLAAEDGEWALRRQMPAQDLPGLTGRTFRGVWTMAEMEGDTLVIADSELLYVFHYASGEWNPERNISLNKQYSFQRETASGHGVAIDGDLLALGKFDGSLGEGVEKSVRVFIRDGGEWLLDKTLSL